MQNLQFITILICMAASAFFAGMETGIVSINRLRIHHLVRRGSHGARIIEDYLRRPEHLLGTTLVGTNLCVVTVSTLSANLAVRTFGPAGRIIAGVSAGILVLVFCEYLPKAWFYGSPEERCVPLANLLRFFNRLFKPISWTLIAITSWIAPRNSDVLVRRSPFVSRESLQYFARDSERGGHISALERLMIDRVLTLQTHTARQIMTAREKIVSVNRHEKLKHFYELVRRHGYIRIPVRDPADDSFVGLLNLFNLIDGETPSEDTPVEAHMRAPLFIPENTRADDILPLFRREGQPIAFVRDAKLRVIGLVTTEDILNAIVGRLPVPPSGRLPVTRETKA